MQRVIYQNKMTDLSDFENVAAADENLIEILRLENDSDEENDGGDGVTSEIASGRTQQNEKCCICLAKRLSVLFVACLHRAVCDDCYTILHRTQKEQHDIMVANLDIHQDDFPPFKIRCPLCRCEQTEAQIITGIYN